jgi:hypothetical protein
VSGFHCPRSSRSADTFAKDIAATELIGYGAPRMTDVGRKTTFPTVVRVPAALRATCGAPNASPVAVTDRLPTALRSGVPPNVTTPDAVASSFPSISIVEEKAIEALAVISPTAFSVV